MRNLLTLAVLSVAGCAAVQLRTEAEAQKYTQCRTNLKEVEMRLVRAGFPVQSKSDQYIQTGWQRAAQTGLVAATLLGEHLTYDMRFIVTEVGPGLVKWTAYERRSRTSRTSYGANLGTSDRASELDVTTAKTEQLESLYRLVCRD